MLKKVIQKEKNYTGKLLGYMPLSGLFLFGGDPPPSALKIVVEKASHTPQIREWISEHNVRKDLFFYCGFLRQTINVVVKIVCVPCTFRLYILYLF